MGYKENIIALLNDKELSQEQKEKLEHIFPELKESEDDRTRKELIRFVECSIHDEQSEQRKAYISWLEKQGQVKEPTISQYEEDEKIRETIIKILLCFDHYEGVTGKDMIAWVKKQGEQKDFAPKPKRMVSAEAKEALYGKPAWSEEDECYMNECIGAIATKDSWSFEEKRKTKHWLKSLKERIE